MKKLCLILILAAPVLYAGTLTITTAQMQALLDDVADKSFVNAYLITVADTTVTNAGSWYPLAGTFSNMFENFVFDTDHITYTGTVSRKFEIDWHCSSSSDDPARTVHYAIKVDSNVLTNQMMGTYLKNATEAQAMSGTVVVELSENDEVQIVLTSSADGDVITTQHFVTTMKKFYPAR